MDEDHAEKQKRIRQALSTPEGRARVNREIQRLAPVYLAEIRRTIAGLSERGASLLRKVGWPRP